MKTKNIVTVGFTLFLICSLVYAGSTDGTLVQQMKDKALSQKYVRFLEQARDVMTFHEKEVFMQLTSDKNRDIFIKRFWLKKEQGIKLIRNNISTLMLLRMTQALDLTESQTAKIFPKVNEIEKEKMETNTQLGKQIRELRLILKQENPDEQEITNKINNIKELKLRLKSREEEFEIFLRDNLTLIQQAKYLVFAQDFYRGLRQILEKARLEKKGRQIKDKKQY